MIHSKKHIRTYRGDHMQAVVDQIRGYSEHTIQRQGKQVINPALMGAHGNKGKGSR